MSNSQVLRTEERSATVHDLGILTNGKRVSLALSKLSNIYFDSDFDSDDWSDSSDTEEYELLCEAQQWEELQYFCK